MKKQSKYTPPPAPTRLQVNKPAELMIFLQGKMGGMSRNSVKSLLAHRQVMVNNTVVTQYNYLLSTKDTVTVKSSRGNTELNHPKLKIIHEDEHLIVIEKKEGLLTVSTGERDDTTAFSILKTYVKKSSPQNRIYTVHRLDRETSGVLVFAKSRDIQLKLQEHWHEAVTSRVYIALVEGEVKKKEGKIVSWLTENEKSLKIHSSETDNGGQQAITHYKVIKSNSELSLLEIELETGRKNQIRVHMQEMGHPIIGDKKYGSTINPISRMGLHARVLEFYHPATYELVRFETAVPRSFLHLFH